MHDPEITFINNELAIILEIAAKQKEKQALLDKKYSTKYEERKTPRFENVSNLNMNDNKDRNL